MAIEKEVRIAPSIVSADLTELHREVQMLEQSGADWIHYDVEDGHFVPEMGLGIGLLQQLAPLTKLPVDVHLMVAEPEAWIRRAAAYGADHITVHIEACPYPRRTLRLIREQGCKAGLAFNPRSNLVDLEYLLEYLDLVNILSTEPEGPDCPFLPAVLDRVQQAADLARRVDGRFAVIADGGVEPSTAPACVTAGAEVLVAGRSIFAGGTIEENLAAIRSSISEPGRK